MIIGVLKDSKRPIIKDLQTLYKVILIFIVFSLFSVCHLKSLQVIQFVVSNMCVI